MKKELTLADTIDKLIKMKDTWLVKPVVERRAIIKEYHRRVDALSVTAPYNTDDGIVHHYGDGTYGREANVQAGVALVGSVYKKPQINILLSGVVFVMTENIANVMEAPCIFTSDANTNKVGYVIEDMKWITVMSRDETLTDPEEILNSHIEGG